MVGFITILVFIYIKYKPAYEVTIDGEKIGYVNNREDFELLIQNEIINQEGKNIADVSLIQEPEYTEKLIERKNNFEEAEIIKKLKNDYTCITYKCYEVALNNETKACVETIEEAEQIINSIKSEFEGNDLELNLQITEEHYTNLDEVNTQSVEVAASNIESAAKEIQEESKVIATVNGIKLSVLPVSGRVTSRYGESSRIRKSTHTGLDIACPIGTPIKALSSGTVSFAAFNGSYGNLIKVDHGNNVETWYAHCSKLLAKVGDKIEAGDVIAYVGTTGNSTGPHLHLEIRIDGNTINPQNYIY